MSGDDLKDRMARAIAAAVFRSQGDMEDDRKHPVMSERRLAAEAAASAALACIRDGDEVSSELYVIRKS